MLYSHFADELVGYVCVQLCVRIMIAKAKKYEKKINNCGLEMKSRSSLSHGPVQRAAVESVFIF